MKFKMTTFVAKLVLTSIGAFLISSSQDSTGGQNPEVEKLLRQGRAMQNDGNYLLAAQIFRSVQSTIADSNQKAEAIFRFVSCGDAEAKHMSINSTPDSLRQVDSFRAIGINLVYLDRFERWSNADTSSRQVLASIYFRSPWGEEAGYDLISDEVSPEGAPAIEDPRVVRDRALAFLNNYPSSRFKYDATHLLGLALQDIWDSAVSGDGSGFVTESEQKNPEAIRLKAVQALSSVVRHRKLLLKTKWDYADETVLKYLRRRKVTPYGFFCCC
jgi:hypothetical protein